MLAIFVNFTALPGIAAVFGFEIPQTNVTVSEEETHSNSFTVYEKTLPPVMNVHHYLSFVDFDYEGNVSTFFRAADHTPPLISIFAPPPEV